MNTHIIKETITKIVPVKIDGKTVNTHEGSTVLEAAQKAGIYIPTLCFLDNIKPYGGCRLCMVEIKNMRGYPTACTTPVAPDIEISTNTPALQKLRREILELILSEHPYTCLICSDKNDCSKFMHTTRKVSVTTGCNFCTNNGDCELQDLVKYLDLKEIQFPVAYRNIKPVKDNPFYNLDYNLCVLCGRCVRICNEERNSETLAFIQRGNATLVGTAFGSSHEDAGCEFCGACIDVCPTGSISEKLGRWAGLPDKSQETTCVYCSVGCKMNINTLGNRIVNVGPKPGARTNSPQLCVRGKFVTGDIAHHPDRILTPLIRKGNKWIEASWDEAIKFTAGNLEKYRGNQFGILGSAHDSIEDNYILQKFARKVMRTNNTDMLFSCSERTLLKRIHDYYSIYPPVEINDITDADTILLIGGQTSWSHPIIENRLRKASKAGKNIIVAHPHYHRTSMFARYNILYKPGEEQSFLLILLANLVKTGASAKDYAELEKAFKNFKAEQAIESCGVEKSEIEEIVKTIANSKKLLIIAGDSVFRNPACIDNFNALCNILKLTKKPDDSRILFLLSEGNRYGGTYIGMHPDYLPGFTQLDDDNNISVWSANWKASINKTRGLSGDEMINKIAEDGITALYVVGDIPAHPNLANLKFLVQQNMFLTETSKYANVFLPAASFTESKGHCINFERKLKEITLVINPPDNVKTAWLVCSLVAQNMFEKGFEYKTSDDIFSEIRSLTDLSFSGTGKSNIKIPFPVDPSRFSFSPSAVDEQFPVRLILETDYFHYRGNILSSVIPDMKTIRKEGILNISPEIANQLNVKDGDSVLITTKFGQKTVDVRLMSDLVGVTAYLRPIWNLMPLITDGLNINNNFIFAKIEKQ